MRILVLTLADAAFADIASISSPNKSRYAERHGYQFECVDTLPDPGRAASWNKIPAIQQRLKDFDWIWWTDADSLVMNGEIRLEEIIGEHPRDLILTKDSNGMNAGQFLIKNSPWSHTFLEEVWSQERFLEDPWWEQAAMMYILGIHPDKRRVLFVPKRTMNAYHSPYFSDYFPGDFLVHFAGLGKEHDRLKAIMLKWKAAAF